MEEELISVIVPIYNTEAYLECCVDSILGQTYKNLEIILVDDGSTDDCSEICDQYARQNSRVKVLHRKNGGISDARNAGLESAHGSLVMFVDSDDYPEPEMTEKLYQALTENSADMSACDFFIFSEMNGYLPKQNSVRPGKSVLSPQEALCNRELFDQRMKTAWAKLYRRELFDGLRFPVGKLHEDIFTMPRICVRAKRIALISERLYNNRIREGSLMRTESDETKLDGMEARLQNAIFLAGIPGYIDAAVWMLEDAGRRVPVSGKTRQTAAFREKISGMQALYRKAYHEVLSGRYRISLKRRVKYFLWYISLYGGAKLLNAAKYTLSFRNP